MVWGFSVVLVRGVIENLGVVNVDVTGHVYVGGLVGGNDGHREQLLFHWQRDWRVSVLAVWWEGISGHCEQLLFHWQRDWRVVDVGGLVGWNWGTVSNSYSTGSVSGQLGCWRSGGRELRAL